MKLQKKIFVTVICIVLAAAIGCGCYVLHLYSYPDGCEHVLIRDGCAKVNDDGTIIWTGTWQYLDIHHGYPDESMMEVRQLAATLRTLPLQKADSLPTDVQIMEFSFMPEEYEFHDKHLCTCIAYDFYTQKIYVNKGGPQWYLLKDEDILDGYIYKALRYPTADLWYGQSTQLTVGVYTYDYENATFRYHLHWQKPPEDFVLPGMREQIQTEGFRNTDEQRVSTREEAILRAAEELGFQDPIGTTFFDETCGYWMVELYEDAVLQKRWAETNLNTALIESVKRVIIDDRGRTVMIGNTYTDPEAFEVWAQAWRGEPGNKS